jgi:predicted lysophospholipase L1 biosynthesis ABC-type transport system permease subunit
MANEIAGVGKSVVPEEGQDWTARATDIVETVVATVRTKTVVPITKVAQILAFGLILAAGAAAVGILFVIALVRVIDVYLPIHPHARAVWVTYAGLGAIFVVVGAFCMRRRTAGPS